MPLLIYGHNSVGKMTVARMYAKALLCDTPRVDSWMPCDEPTCTSCSIFELPGSGSIDFRTIDAANRDHQDASKVQEALGYVPHGPRHVIIIENFELAPTDFVDALLKELEKEVSAAAPRTFIILAKDFKDVREAGQSRCEIETLRPLGHAEMRELCVRVLARYEVKLAVSDAFEAIVVGARGLPSRLVDACLALKASSPASKQDVLRALHLEWGAPMLQLWQEILAGSFPPSLLDGEILGRKVAIYSRFVFAEVLGALRSGNCGASGEPALSLAGEDAVRRLTVEFKKKADDFAVSPEVLLSDLSDVFRIDDFAYPAGVQDLSRAVRMVLQTYRRHQETTISRNQP